MSIICLSLIFRLIGTMNAAPQGRTQFAVSKDGTRIAYVGWDVGSRTHSGDYEPLFSRIYVFDLDASKFSAATNKVGQDRAPSYSPDGKEIAFISNRSGHFELWLMAADGRRLRRITDLARSGYEAWFDRPAWSPDGRRLAFTAVPLTRQLSSSLPFEG